MEISAPFSSSAREPVLCESGLLNLPAEFVQRMAGDVEADSFLFAARRSLGVHRGRWARVGGWRFRRSSASLRTTRPGHGAMARAARWPASMRSSMAANSGARVPSRLSMAPDLIRFSMTRLLTAPKSTRSQNSKRVLNGPPSVRAAKMASTALEPTILTAASPKRMASPSGVKWVKLAFTSGGNTRMPRSRHSFMYFTIFSACRFPT